MDDAKRAYDFSGREITCKICGKEIQGRGMNAHMRWHVKNGDAAVEDRERVVTDHFAVFPNGLEYKF
ncbi:MAG: hypothetical protein AB7E51_00400 [Pseudodesulfovibrio sp.]|uniref:hypothetical protein n=1 Tax=Pseudodesulfovibrio sp. TaxID=2035812 RepID=UPI003D10E944